MWSLLLPSSCGVCGRCGPSPCGGCWRRLEPAGPLATIAGVDRCQSLLRYDGAGRELVARLKYRNARSSVSWLAAGMAALAAGPADRFDAVTWAPTSDYRRRRRGFDQAELLARAIGPRLAVPVRRLLLRLPGPAQTGHGREQRRVAPRFVDRGCQTGARVLLVDDVLTTGATIEAAAHALRQGGVEAVTAVTAARTPLKVEGAHVEW